MKITLNLESKHLIKLKKAIAEGYVKKQTLNQLINNIINKWIELQEDL